MRGERDQKIDEALTLVVEGREINKEAHQLLDLIAIEFETDPMSVQCFDLRVVERVKELIRRRRQWQQESSNVDPYLLQLARGEIE